MNSSLLEEEEEEASQLTKNASVDRYRMLSLRSKFSAIVLRLEQEMASNVYGAARLSMDAAVVAAISTCNFSEQSKFSR